MEKNMERTEKTFFEKLKDKPAEKNVTVNNAATDITVNNATTLKKVNNDTTTPITREELAAFMILFQNSMSDFLETLKTEFVDLNVKNNNRIDQILISLNDKGQQLTNSVNNLMNSQLETAKAIKESWEISRRQIYAISNKFLDKENTAKPNTIFNSSMTPVEQSRWAKKVWGELSKLCEASGVPEGKILSEIYGEMLNSGYNTKSLFEEYKKQNPGVEKRIEMFSKSDILMKSFGVGFNAVWKKYKNNKLNSDSPEMKNPANFNVSTMTPANAIDEIRKAICALSSTGKISGQVYSKAYRLTNRKYGISIRDEAAKIIKTNKLSKTTSVAAAIAKDANLSGMMCKAVYEFVNNTGSANGRR